MKTFLPLLVMDVVAWLPVENSQSHGGLFSHWELDTQLFSRSKLHTEFEPLQSLDMPLQSNDSPIDAFENLDLNVNCDPSRAPYNLYQSNLRGARSFWPVLQNGQQAGLTEQETVAIFGWTWRDYLLINPIAWGADEVQAPGYLFFGTHESLCTLYKADVLPAMEVLNSALNKLPPVQNVTLWRGSPQSADELGDVITGGFSSTSPNLVRALGFAGQSLWVIESFTSGKDITNFSVVGYEEEVLFPMGSRFEVVECSPTTMNATQQKIEEIDRTDAWRALDIICMKEAGPPGPPSPPADAETMLV